jgi:flagellar hook-length control protein FliK
MAAAPNILEAASTAPAAPAAGPVAPGSGFDSILLSQNLAALAETLDAAQFEAGDTADLLATDESDDEDKSDDLEASLAFLSALLTATSPPGAANSSPGDFAAGAQSQGGSDGDAGSLLKTLEGDAKASFLLAGEGKDAKPADPLALLPVRPELLETRTPAGDSAQSLARAAEMLTQVQRSVAVAAPETTVATHVRDPRWADDFSARVSLMVRAGESTASLQLTPVDLGPVEVNVTVKDSQATIHFGATQADTRALLEASLPKLRELLASQGFNLMDASVSSGFSRSQQQSQANSPGSRPGAEGDAPAIETQAIRQLGLLDTYA